MFERFTKDAIKTMMLAQEESRRMKTKFVGSEQFLLGIIGTAGKAARLLANQGLDLKSARQEVEKIVGLTNDVVPIEIPFNPRAKRILERSWDEARKLGQNFISPEHLLLGLIRDNEGIAARVLENKEVGLDNLERELIESLKQQGPDGPSDPNDSDPFFMS